MGRKVLETDRTAPTDQGNLRNSYRILNVGCGYQTYGTDFVDFYPCRDDVKQCDISSERLPYRDNTFDEVYSRCVFEHLVNPLLTLKEMKRVLKPGGRLVVITDNAGFWAFHTPMSKTHYGGYEESDESEDRHYALYTTWHLENFMRKLGMVEWKSRYDNVAEFHESLAVRIGSGLLKLFRQERMAYPNVKVTGIK